MITNRSEPRTKPRQSAHKATRVGCVSFLNAKPLIEGHAQRNDLHVTFAVPSRLLDGLENGDVDIALCPVIDFQRSKVPLKIVPVGGIGCEGITLTVRLYSQVPIDQITTVHADTDSHTSVALLTVLLAQRLGRKPKLIDFNVPASQHYIQPDTRPEALLLIGDKTVNDSPPAVLYPFQLDLGEAWHELTGMPFVFATWMARADAELGNLPKILREMRLFNAKRISEISREHAPRCGWPVDLAEKYLGHWLKYETEDRHLKAIEKFWFMAAQIGLIANPPRAMKLHRVAE